MNNTISPDSFAMLCFLVLMQNGAGLIGKAPIYITEKIQMLSEGETAFAYLDIHNMRKVIQYCDTWRIQVPEHVQQEFDLQQAAMEKLQGRGMEL